MSSRRVIRGGSCNLDSRYLRTTVTSGGLAPESRDWNGGFRVVVKRRKP